eukprot:TRINITY_DN2122_c0_g2_i1.p1 TRINITY_DN2122_c0_g2~~TRINITY_DN2122_c0_g2_i1.p1  ORF type:complete len:442 (-),score=93.35 TRINITY_DN2122_c0_g2_i1:113-1438(-)
MGVCVSCFVGAMGKVCCSACDSVKPTNGYSARIPYLFMVFCTIIFALIIKLWLSGLVINLYFYTYTACSNDACAGNQGVFRFSFALALFFITMLMFVCAMKSQSLHTGMWVLKGIYYFLLIVVAFVIPNTFYNGYANVARFGSVIFLLLQMFVIIDLAYRWNSSWVAKADAAEAEGKSNQSKKWLAGILIVCAICYLVSIAGWGLMYKYLAGSESCGTERFAISFTLIICTAFSIMSVSGVAEYGALLPSAVLSLYSTYLLFTGLKSNPNTTCNLYTVGTTTSAQSDPLQIIVGLGFAAASITYSCYSLTSDGKVFFGGASPSPAREDNIAYDDEAQKPKTVTEKPSDDAEVEAEESEEVLADPQVRKTTILFHIILLLASMYFGMLLTDWASNLYDNSNQITSLGKANMWVNVASAWAIGLLYIWTLVAPKVCAGRDFSQ